MAKLNVWKRMLTAQPAEAPAGAEARREEVKDAHGELRRLVLAGILWDDLRVATRWKSGEGISELVRRCSAAEVAALAVEARARMGLRHAPLVLVREISRQKGSGALVADALEKVIHSADDITEFVALYWKDGKQPLSAGVKRGLARAFANLDAYRLAKHDRDAAVKLRDVLFLCHAKPKDAAQAALWKKLADGVLPAPETWESVLAASRDKKRAWETLLQERKLSLRTLLRNLPAMREAGAGNRVIRARLAQVRQREMPFAFLVAARSAPQLSEALEQTMLRALQSWPKLPGATRLLVDVSRTMGRRRVADGGLTALDAEAGLAILLREACLDLRVATYSEKCVEVPRRRGFALRAAIEQSQAHLGSRVRLALRELRAAPQWRKAERLIVLSDKQTQGLLPTAWSKYAYAINLAPQQHGVRTQNGWTHIEGWSNRVLDYIVVSEAKIPEP